jgi:hypothetical protein
MGYLEPRLLYFVGARLLHLSRAKILRRRRTLNGWIFGMAYFSRLDEL